MTSRKRSLAAKKGWVTRRSGKRLNSRSTTSHTTHVAAVGALKQRLQSEKDPKKRAAIQALIAKHTRAANKKYRDGINADVRKVQRRGNRLI